MHNVEHIDWDPLLLHLKGTRKLSIEQQEHVADCSDCQEDWKLLGMLLHWHWNAEGLFLHAEGAVGRCLCSSCRREREKWSEECEAERAAFNFDGMGELETEPHASRRPAVVPIAIMEHVTSSPIPSAKLLEEVASKRSTDPQPFVVPRLSRHLWHAVPVLLLLSFGWYLLPWSERVFKVSDSPGELYTERGSEMAEPNAALSAAELIATTLKQGANGSLFYQQLQPIQFAPAQNGYRLSRAAESYWSIALNEPIAGGDWALFVWIQNSSQVRGVRVQDEEMLRSHKDTPSAYRLSERPFSVLEGWPDGIATLSVLLVPSAWLTESSKLEERLLTVTGDISIQRHVEGALSKREGRLVAPHGLGYFAHVWVEVGP